MAATASKMLSDAPTLTYADRQTYARGLRELEGPLPLTLAQEWLRDDQWTSFDGKAFSAAREYAYVRGLAGSGDDAFMRTLYPNAGARTLACVSTCVSLIPGSQVQRSGAFAWTVPGCAMRPTVGCACRSGL